MKKRNFLTVLVLTVFCLGSFTSCSNKGIASDSNSASQITVNIPDLEKETESADIITADLYQYDTDTMKKLFLTDKNTDTIVNDGKWLTYDRNNSLTNYRLLITNFSNESFFRNDLKSLFTKKGDSELDQTKCEAVLEPYLAGLELKNLTPSQTYFLDAETLNKLEREIISDKDYKNARFTKEPRIRNWTKENEAYLFIYQYEMEGIPVSSDLYASIDGAEAMDSSFLYAIVTKDGLVTLESCGRYQKISAEKAKLVSAKKALDTVLKQYENMTITDPVTVNDVHLEYFPTYDKEKDNYILNPGWVFQLKTDDVQDNIFNRTVAVDAIKGEAIN